MKLMKIGNFICLFVFFFALFLFFKLPATWLVQRMPSLDQNLERNGVQISGTVWQGAGHWRYERQSFEGKWSLSPLCLLIGRLCLDLQLDLNHGDSTISQLDGHLETSLFGLNSTACVPKINFNLESFNGAIYHGWLGLLSNKVLNAGAKWADHISINDLNLEMDLSDWSTTSANGELTWPGGALSVRQGSRWLSYSLPGMVLKVSETDSVLLLDVMTIPSAGKSVLPVVKLNVGPDASATLKVFKSIGVFTGQLSSRANPKEIMYEEVFQLNSFLCG